MLNPPILPELTPSLGARCIYTYGSVAKNTTFSHLPVAASAHHRRPSLLTCRAALLQWEYWRPLVLAAQQTFGRASWGFLPPTLVARLSCGTGKHEIRAESDAVRRDLLTRPSTSTHTGTWSAGQQVQVWALLTTALGCMRMFPALCLVEWNDPWNGGMAFRPALRLAVGRCVRARPVRALCAGTLAAMPHGMVLRHKSQRTVERSHGRHHVPPRLPFACPTANVACMRCASSKVPGRRAAHSLSGD
eukprot:354633-Chlamydomonas_euryale.AAC.15